MITSQPSLATLLNALTQATQAGPTARATSGFRGRSPATHSKTPQQPRNTSSCKAHVGAPTFLDPGWQLPSPEVVFPTFTRGAPKTSPPPHGRHCKTETPWKQRWNDDKSRQPAYQYSDSLTVGHPSGKRRPLNVEERGTLTGFPLDHTFPCWPSDRRDTHSNARRCQ